MEIKKNDDTDQAPIDERRVVVISIPIRLLGIILFSYQNCKNVAFPKFKNIPDGARLRSVQFDFMRNSFLMEVEHESFENVGEGRVAPSVDYECEIIQIPKEEKKKGRGSEGRRVITIALPPPSLMIST